MVNPVRGFISKGRLFADQDVDSSGIRVYHADAGGAEGLINLVRSVFFQERITVDIAGDIIDINRADAESFFARNKFEGIIDESMPPEEKIVRLARELGRPRSELPLGMLQQVGPPDKGGAITGLRQQFHSLAKSLSSNGFQVSWLEEQLELQEGKYLQIDRDLFFKKIVEENITRLPFLESSGRADARSLMLLLIDLIKRASEPSSSK